MIRTASILLVATAPLVAQTPPVNINITPPVQPQVQPAAQPAPAQPGVQPGAQQPAQPGAQPAPVMAIPQPGNGQFLGNAIPILNPGSEVFTWDGQSWNITDQRVFRARFEKYLNTPEQTSEEDKEYQALLTEIYNDLAPGSDLDLVDAWSKLPRASAYDDDANLSDSLADAVYAVWLAKKERYRLEGANRKLDEEMKTLEWSARVKSQNSTLRAPSSSASDGVVSEWQKDRELDRQLRMKPVLQRMAEVEAMRKANLIKHQASQLQAKIEFQALIAQFFFQRRFQHVTIGSRFYRKLFGDGDNQLKLGKKTQDLLTDASGLPPTLSVLDSLANEAMADVRESVDAYNFLLKQGELNSATQRLAEAFMIGEFMPEIRTLTRDKKRQALEFTQLSNQLLSSISVKDYTRAEKIVKELEEKAKDFDNTPYTAEIETAKTMSALILAKAKNAAASGDRATLENELKAAMAIWPRNPELAEVSGKIFDQTNVQQQALNDLDRLMSQKNYRQIYEDKVRYIAATALHPEKQEELRGILENMQVVETAIIQANEIAKRGDAFGAWESIERAFDQFPNDIKLNQLRAELTTRAAEFVRSLAEADRLEEQGQYGSSLAWFLKAQELYPASDFAKEGIARVVAQILPETGPAPALPPASAALEAEPAAAGQEL